MPCNKKVVSWKNQVSLCNKKKQQKYPSGKITEFPHFPDEDPLFRHFQHFFDLLNPESAFRRSYLQATYEKLPLKKKREKIHEFTIVKPSFEVFYPFVRTYIR